MKIEIETDAFDDIFKAILIDDWKKVKEEGKRLNSSEITFSTHEDEIKYNKKLRKAYERIIRYVCTYYEAEEILGKKEKPVD